MECVFQGESSNKVDGKGRMSLPVKYRRALQAGDQRVTRGDPPRLFIAYGDPRKKSVSCLTGNYYDALRDKILAMDDGTPGRALLQFLYFTKCDEVSVDESGRFVLPQAAREKLDLDGEALFQGTGESFLILNPKDVPDEDAKMLKVMEELSDGQDFFDPISLANEAPARAGAADVADPADGP